MFLCLVAGAVWHKCSIDSLKEDNSKMLQQLLESSDYQTKQLSETVAGVKTIESQSISPDLLTDALKKEIEKYNLESVYAAQLSIQASLLKVLDGVAGATTAIPRPPTTGTTTIIVRPPTNGNNNPNNTGTPVNPDIPANNSTPTPESVDSCNTCLAANILRVPVDTTSGPLRIHGYTDTGPKLGDPGSFHLEAEWIKQIQIQIALTQNEDGSWQTLVDSMDPEISVDRIESQINVSPFQQRWYQNIVLGVGTGFGRDIALLSGMLGYRITKNFLLSAGWFYTMPYDGEISDYNHNAIYSVILQANL